MAKVIYLQEKIEEQELIKALEEINLLLSLAEQYMLEAQKLAIKYKL